MSDSLKVVVIGAGYFSQFHLQAWQRIEGAVLAAIVEPDRSKHNQLSTDYPGVAIFQSLERAFEHSAADIVDIVVPPAEHYELVCQAMALSHEQSLIICQKPFCTSLQQASALTAVAQLQRRKLVIHENFRFQPWYAQIRSMLERGVLGDVMQAGFRLRPGDGRGAKAYLQRQPYFQTMPRFLIRETGIHWVDTFRYLFGEPDWVYAELRRINEQIAGEDAGLFTFSYTHGPTVVFDGNRHLDHAAQNKRLTMGEMRIEGSEATLDLDGDGGLRLRGFGQNLGRQIDYQFSQQGFAGDCVYRLQQHIVEHMREGGPLHNTATEYLRNIELQELIYQSAKSGQRLACAPE